MLAITQFELYVLQKGRWLLHARYPGEERNEAVLDARTTEHTTGFPSKVIRETYFPDINESERITTYISQKAKDATKPLTANQRRTAIVARAANVLTRKRPAGTPRPRLTAAQTFSASSLPAVSAWVPRHWSPALWLLRCIPWPRSAWKWCPTRAQWR